MSEITIFKHAIVITMDPKRSILEDGAVVVEADKILAVGPTDSVARKYKADHEIDAQKKADLIAVNLDTPRLTPIHSGECSNILQHLVYAAHGDDVDAVMVDGRIVMEKKKLLTVDESEVVHSEQRTAHGNSLRESDSMIE